MIELLLVFALMLLLLTGMAVGVLFGRAPIKGTCGGLNAMGGQASCELCGGDPARCDGDAPAPRAAERADLALDVMAEPSRHR